MLASQSVTYLFVCGRGIDLSVRVGESVIRQCVLVASVAAARLFVYDGVGGLCAW